LIDNILKVFTCTTFTLSLVHLGTNPRAGDRKTNKGIRLHSRYNMHCDCYDLNSIHKERKETHDDLHDAPASGTLSLCEREWCCCVRRTGSINSRFFAHSTGQDSKTHCEVTGIHATAHHRQHPTTITATKDDSS
jgi:hypothetical protein